MRTPLSLRIRLTLIILVPLLGIAVLVGAWAVNDAQSRASERFDRSLLSAALAISRDIVVSEGDALSPETNTLLRDTSGGPVFYHVYAPDGVFVTGYATPPVAPAQVGKTDAQQTYFDALYKSKAMRVLRFRDAMQIDGLTGIFTFTVWQETALRTAIVQDLSTRTFSVIASLMIALALIVWFGVRFGLSPLTDLQAAIAQRSSDELTPIRRSVPKEVTGIVQTLNALLAQVDTTLQAKDDFISNAAHQLRNPIAGVVAMSEAVASARTAKDTKERSADLVIAARHASDLANQLLTHERAKGNTVAQAFVPVDVNQLTSDLTNKRRPECAARGVTLEVTLTPDHPQMAGDIVLLGEAILNLIDNSLTHAAPPATRLSVTVDATPKHLTLTFQDNGPGIPEANLAQAMERFVQLSDGPGSGLGLAIVKAVAEAHGGRLELQNTEVGFAAVLVLPSIAG